MMYVVPVIPERKRCFKSGAEKLHFFFIIFLKILLYLDKRRPLSSFYTQVSTKFLLKIGKIVENSLEK